MLNSVRKIYKRSYASNLIDTCYRIFKVKRSLIVGLGFDTKFLLNPRIRTDFLTQPKVYLINSVVNTSSNRIILFLLETNLKYLQNNVILKKIRVKYKKDINFLRIKIF